VSPSTERSQDVVQPVRLAVVGTGAIGSLHARLAIRLPEVSLVAVSTLQDALPGAESLGVSVHAEYRELIDAGIDGVIVAVPNRLHLDVGAYFASHGVHVLVEKPIADTLAAGQELCEVATAHDVHLLVGHHRRYSNLVKVATEVVATRLGRLVATNAMVTMRKPDSYYQPEWRRSAGAGPLLVNLIHEIDVQRVICGEIDRVQAAAKRVGRTFEFDDTAGVLLHFRNGALGTLVLSDSTPSPWSWECSVTEGLGFHNAGRDYAAFVGTEAALGFPGLSLWSYDPSNGEPGWMSPLMSRRVDVEPNDPYADQLVHFSRVIRGLEQPVVTGGDGLRSLAVVAAIGEAARTGGVVEVDELIGGDDLLQPMG
jgi:predicted dehydrogenase